MASILRSLQPKSFSKTSHIYKRFSISKHIPLINNNIILPRSHFSTTTPKMSTTMSDTPVEFLATGAIIKNFNVAGVNIALGFPTEAIYKSTGNGPFFGETIGRVANRISGAKIESLNGGKSYKLEANEAGRTNLHGGSKGWGKQTWEGPKPVNRNGREEVMFRYHSPDGDAGFPGAVEARVYYSVEKVKNDGVQLDWEYEIELVGDEVDETVVNVTNHGFWNLSGESTIEGTELTLDTADHLPIDGHGIPTKEITSFPGITAKKSVTLGAKDISIDHCFVLNKDFKSVGIDTRSSGLQHALHMYHPKTGIHLDVETTEPAFQVYTGEGINVPEINEGGHKVAARGARSGIAIEPSRYVNAVNVEEWKHQVALKKGKVWGSKSRFTAYKQ